MADLLIRKLPDDLSDAVRKRAADRGQSLSDAAKDLMRAGLREDVSGVKPGPVTTSELLRSSIDGLIGDDEFEEFERVLTEARKQGDRHIDLFDDHS